MLSFSYLVILFVLGFIGSFLSGMLGVGGAIINYPMLLYIPPLLGFAALTAHSVSGIVAVQVFFATLTGVFAYRKSRYLNKGLIMYMGISILIGSLLGGVGSRWVSNAVEDLVYGILALLAVILIFIPRKEERNLDEPHNFNRFWAIILSFLVGVSAGIVGAGGAFLLVPIMLTVLKIPLRVTIATSLAVTFISSIGSTFGKLVSHQVLFIPALIVVLASIIASPLGAMLGQRLNAKVLKGILAFLIVMTAIKVWSSIL
ncbi:sulfite exporter TauE/SafE family protein [Pullulanibacillus sp. KACC 23026]|uniref:sulfite exporter TauE/SafE family protein n=1 Tax=Pullulanibacillus sp. KACC 23026 TaxID=3028315 RepID=UPI0023AEF448|nr:sulfite exporter TauE/SafE family protein [Pullulanibacillus sp. KACC 23026]WEG12119.1 sulfite exporter TauE/SafE family protein [Pullulanibacillus sp. KACC 23026]